MSTRLQQLARRGLLGLQSRPCRPCCYSSLASSSTRAVKAPPVNLRYASSRKSGQKKTTMLLDDMPAAKVDKDGMVVGPLDDITDANRPRHTGRKTPEEREAALALARSTAEDNEKYAAEVRAGRVPARPLSRLVWENWKRFPDCILLTQVGNFYESYFEPAIEVSSLLGTKLTSKTYRNGKHPFTGFPIHQIDKYLKLLVQDLGRTVVLVEEEVDPDMVERQPEDEVLRKVARIVTPGTLVDDSWLTGNESRYLLAIAIGDAPVKSKKDETQHPIYLAYADVSTGEFFTKEATTSDIEDELARISPREVVLDARWRDIWVDSEPSAEQHVMHDVLSLLRALGVHVSFTKPFQGDGERCKRKDVYNPLALERSAIRILHHHLEYALRENMPAMPENPEDFNREYSATQMHIDAATLQALEVRHAMRPGGLMSAGPASGTAATPLSVKGTLLSVISRTVTDSGHRLLKRTLAAPSTDLAVINSRLSLVSAFVDREPLRTDIRENLRRTGDVMRILQRFRARRGDGSDVLDVAKWIREVERIIERIELDIGSAGKRKRKSATRNDEGAQRLALLVESFSSLRALASDIESAIDETKLSSLLAGEEDEDSSSVIESPSPKKKAESRREEEQRKRDERFWLKPSFSTDLEELHSRLTRLEKKYQKMQTKLQDEFEAPGLRLTTSQRHGFVATVKKKTEFGQLDRSDKFVALSETISGRTWMYNDWSILGDQMDRAYNELDIAQSRALNRLRAMVIEHASAIQRNAELVDEIDLAAGFAQVAVDRNFVRPQLDNSTDLTIVNGRHPSVEAGLHASVRMFTPNTTEMKSDSHLHVITGPNQGGKSTLLRQTAVIAILAQAGSFVPADAARIGIVDRVFSRIGARDDLFRDRSTFMLEMVETAAILKNATPRSLVIMDEIGRGTTLNAGMSIAYATLDYILQNIKCRTMFATHYHELARMLGVQSSSGPGKAITPLRGEATRPGVAFWCTDVDEMDGLFAYSYRLKPGINYNSHAIKAAELAGMPDTFLKTAAETLQQLNNTDPA